MTGTFGTLTFDNAGIDNLYSDATTHDVSYATTVGAVALTVAHDAQLRCCKCNICHQLHTLQAEWHSH